MRSFRAGWAIAVSATLIALGVFPLAPSVSADTPFTFSTGVPDGRMAMASQPPGGPQQEIEAADDFLLGGTMPTSITGATFTGLLPSATPLSSVTEVDVEIYRVFPLDSTVPPSGNVPTRNNSPSDNAFTSADSSAGTLTFSARVLSASFSAANSVVNGINKVPNQTTGGEGAVTGEEVQFSVTLTPALSLAPNHYFFVPQVHLSTAGSFLWLSAPRPIVAPGTPFTPDLQSWIRNNALDPDWLRVGTDIVGGATPPTFNGVFSLQGVIGKLTPTVVTSATSPVTVGGTISDTATVGGGLNPTGTITFNVYGPGDTGCTTPLGSSQRTVNGDGNYTSDPFTTSATGTYRWVASYSGDANNNLAVTSCTDPAEASVVQKATTQIVTMASPSVTVGGLISDSAILSGGFNPTGTITFNAFGPANPGCTGSPAFTATVPVNGNGTYSSGALFPAAGTYNFAVSYSGDANNGAAMSPCGSPNESVTVTCDTTVTGNHLGTLVLGPGVTCILNAHVTGSVIVPRGSAVDVENSTIEGAITASGPSGLRLCGTVTGGSVSVGGASGFVLIGDPGDDGCAVNFVTGSLTLVNNSHGLEAIGNHVGGSVTVSGNSGTGPYPEDTAPDVTGNGH